jgi:uncharacterized protein YndB with AHSA1/START domain
MKKWILYPIGGLAAVVALAYIIGLTRSPEVRADISLEVARPPEAVYKLVADPNEIPKYWPEVGKIEIIQQSPMRYRMVSSEGSGTMEVVSADPPRRIVTKTIEHSMGVDGIWDTTIVPTPTGSRIDHKSVLQFHNPFLRTLAMFMNANAEEMKTLQAIKTYAESH